MKLFQNEWKKAERKHIMRTLLGRKRFWMCLAGIVALLLLENQYAMLFPRKANAASIVQVERARCYAVVFPTGDTLYCASLDADSLPVDVASRPADVEVHDCATGFWFSSVGLFSMCNGRVATSSRMAPDAFDFVPSVQQSRLLSDRVARKADSLDHVADHLDYFMQTHSLQDEGYNDIAQLEASISIQRSLMDSLQALLAQTGLQNPLHIVPIVRYTLRTSDGLLFTANLDKTPSRGRPYLTLQTTDKRTPIGACPLRGAVINPKPFLPSGAPLKCSAYHMALWPNVADSLKPATISLTKRTWFETDTTEALPWLPTAEGAPVTTVGGVLVGVVGQTSVCRL